MQTYFTPKTGLRLGVTGMLAALALTAFVGCGSNGTTVTVTRTVPALPLPYGAPPPPKTTASTPTPPPAASYPVVHFNLDTGGEGQEPPGVWPFTAQLADIKLTALGTPASPTIPPQFTYMLVQLNLTSLTTGRIVPSPGAEIHCHAPGDSSWKFNEDQQGYDEGEAVPDSEGVNVAPGEGKPLLWDAEWRVPITTTTTNVKCVLVVEEGTAKHDLKLN